MLYSRIAPKLLEIDVESELMENISDIRACGAKPWIMQSMLNLIIK